MKKGGFQESFSGIATGKNWLMIYENGWDSHQHNFDERAVFVGCGVMAVGTNETNMYRRTERRNTVFEV